jgi:protease-4
MKRFGVGFVIGILFTALVAVILIFAVMRFGGERKVVVADGSTLVVHLEGELPEQGQLEIPLPFLEQQEPMTMVEVWQLFRRAAEDSRIKAIVLEPRSLSAGWAKLEELHDDIAAFRKSGKPVYAFLRGATAREYYVATAADRIYMTPEDELDVKGLRVEMMFVKGTLDKLGVQMEFEHVGKYKDAPDMFTRKDPTPETLEVTNEILDQYYGNLVQTIAQGRNKSPDQIRAAIDNGPFVGREALDNGFVDALLFEDEVYGELKQRLHAEIKKIGEQDYARAPSSDSGSKIAFLVGDGDITRGGPHDDGSESGITATSMLRLLREVGDDSSIKGVILRIDSPGGDGIASDDILHAAKAVSAKKPMVVSMSDLAASGGYFIAMTGDPLIAYPNTLTGSIGVFFGKPDLRGLYDKIGVNKDTLKRGRFADIDTDYRPLSDEERAKLRNEIEVFYRGFVERVAAGRKRSYDQIEPLAQGRVWLGAQAKQNGLIDELGGLDRALEMIKQRAKIPASEKVTLVTYPPKRTIWDLLWSRPDDAAEVESLIAKRAASTLGQPAASLVAQRATSIMGRFPVRALIHGGILAVMPYSIEVK